MSCSNYVPSLVTLGKKRHVVITKACFSKKVSFILKRIQKREEGGGKGKSRRKEGEREK